MQNSNNQVRSRNVCFPIVCNIDLSFYFIEERELQRDSEVKKKKTNFVKETDARILTRTVVHGRERGREKRSAIHVID